ncbi:MAG: hypothetical protein LBH18_03715 [Spirochaetaceae bacterium]|nr:hypothetical protein [Spirochaetaceae bacterium]
MKTNKIWGFMPLIAMLVFAVSCDGGGGDISSVLGIGDDTPPPQTYGITVAFDGNGGQPLLQNVKLDQPLYLPEIEFTAEGMTKEQWLSGHGVGDYDFVADPAGYGPNWTGNGAEAIDPGQNIVGGGGGNIPS